MRKPTPQFKQSPSAFTLIEILVVIVIIGILVGLLVPAIAGAVRATHNAAVSAEINQLANGLENFKTRYGDYPPSRILLCENGNYSAAYLASNPPAVENAGSADISLSLLAQRSVSYFRRFFPLVQISTNGAVTITQLVPSAAVNGGQGWYDFNGNAVPDAPYILQGHECLVLFLGGVPLYSGGVYGMTGFGKMPQNPFSGTKQYTPSGAVNPMYSMNRNNPFFEFRPGQLVLDPQGSSQVPGYLDSLGNGPPTGNGPPCNFYAYFSAYGNNNYDPNDVNFVESDPSNANSPTTLSVNVTSSIGVAVSPGPNPYTGSLTRTGTTTYQKPNSFQIISSGYDGIYGVGGQYAQKGSASTVPFDTSVITPIPVYNSSDTGLRIPEYDNLTNFTAGKLN